MNKFKLFFLLLTSCCFMVACSDLEEELNDGTTTPPPPESLLDGAYANIRNIQSQDNMLALTQHTSDEMAGPTRGQDWDDAGVWRVMHNHTWGPTHAYVGNVWRTLNSISFDASQVLCAGATGQIAAEATFVRALGDYLVLDNFGQLPRRECGEFLGGPASILLNRAELASIIIGELEAVMDDLPEGGEPGRASKNAARALLAKLYLNKAVYEASTDEGGAPKAQEGPYNFAKTDMDKVVELVDAMTGVSLDENYFDNFTPDNGESSSELIFTSPNTSGAAAGNVRAYWFMTTHYNQNPSGWNGFVALTDLYDRFTDPNDQRLGGNTLPYITDEGSGMTVGFQIGQQFDVDGNPLEDRKGNPLAFTREFNLQESGDFLEVTGIRCVKYTPDFSTPGDAADNDYVIFRYADALLMKAEAIMRGGSGSPSAEEIVNELRAARGAGPISGLTMNDILDERSRELYWEGWRRNDQIRFNTFLGTWQEKDAPSDATRLLFPIPADALATNPNLRQNAGY